jgi:DNA-binding transcriptional LysR family regulator
MNRIRLDLNLLRAFDAVFRHRGLTAAAAELNLSQPAVSHAVRRLRTYYQDPLFRRIKGKMEPTSRALDISEPIALAMEQIGRTERSVFDPSTAKRTFHVAIVNYAAVHLLPAVMDDLGHQAPRVRVLTSFLSSQEAEDQIQKGELDLIIGVVAPGGCHQRVTLFRDELVVIACKGRAAHLGKELAVKDLNAASHVYLPQLPGIERIAEALAKVPHSIFSAANVGSIPFNIMRSNRIALVPKSTASIFQPYFDLDILRPPWEFAPYRVEMLWHARVSRDAAHSWIHSAIRKTAVELERKYYSSLRGVRSRPGNRAAGARHSSDV